MRSFKIDSGHFYKSTTAGIIVPVYILRANKSIEVKAKLDTGAAFCLFERIHSEVLEIDVESGELQRFKTVTGIFHAFEHHVTLRTYGLEWDTRVYFYESWTSHGSFLGRTGWLDQICLGLVHHDERIYLDRYDDAN